MPLGCSLLPPHISKWFYPSRIHCRCLYPQGMLHGIRESYTHAHEPRNTFALTWQFVNMTVCSVILRFFAVLVLLGVVSGISTSGSSSLSPLRPFLNFCKLFLHVPWSCAINDNVNLISIVRNYRIFLHEPCAGHFRPFHRQSRLV